MGIKLGFIATRSGLMRFSDHSHLFEGQDDEKSKKKFREQGADDEDLVPEP